MAGIRNDHHGHPMRATTSGGNPVRFVLKYAVEAVIGLTLAVLLVIALAATVSTVPFIYQGY